ncbi:glycosyltransferase family 4 protein [Allokutzneria sp. NRRL B-24872]|uniref:glycosyltransferase family 4 protein n=1 Tax=Allokutzneria sp. NRRL B-24872 TaxID=1137961 RepID=UPI000A3BE7CA|nr:glycosyltransferase family 4 protein [Allokutzneria sp. NRRL B-24872]
MRVLMLSWEYPPVVVGGLGRHVHALARQLAAQGHEVVVLCRQPFGTDAETHPTSDQVADGVRLIRVAEDPPHLSFEQDLVAWTLGIGHAMTRAGLRLLAQWRPEVVHAHDWLVTHAAVTLAEVAGAPLIATVHATEAGRYNGWLSQPLNQQIHSVEWWLATSADSVITCSAAMRDEAAALFDIDPDAVTVLHNGIEPRSWRVRPSDIEAAKRRFSPDGAPFLLFFGRLEWEKGVHDLLAALPRIRRSHPGTRAVIAGKGTGSDWLVEQARKHRVLRSVEFVGHLSDRDLAASLAAADAVVLPSRYEPFGIVALEAAAAGAPLVASTAGGLGEVVLDGVTGLSFPPGDVDVLAAAVRAVLDDPAAARRRAKAAKARLSSDFDWAKIASGTADVYAAARRGPEKELGRPKIASGNAFGRH